MFVNDRPGTFDPVGARAGEELHHANHINPKIKKEE